MSGATRHSFGIAVAALAVAVAGAAYASAQNTAGPNGPFRQVQDGPGRAGGPGRFGGPMALGPMGPGRPLAGLPLERLQLTDAQRDQVRAIMQSHEQEMKALGDRARQAREALDQAIVADSFDENQVRARAADVAAVDADLVVAQARIRGEVVQQVLTPEQQAQLRTLQAERQQRMQSRPEGRGRR